MFKKNKVPILILAFAATAILSFFAGSYSKEQEYRTSRSQRCGTLISFAIDKAENQDLQDSDTMEALISNLYAAYEYCDNPGVSAQLHELWNTLVFEGDSYAGKKEELVTQLRDIVQQLEPNG